MRLKCGDIFNFWLRTNSYKIVDKTLAHKTYIPKNHEHAICSLNACQLRNLQQDKIAPFLSRPWIVAFIRSLIYMTLKNHEYVNGGNITYTTVL